MRQLDKKVPSLTSLPILTPRSIYRFFVPIGHSVLGYIFIGVLLLLCGTTSAGALSESSRTLHSGWKISPAGVHQSVGDMLLGSALSPDGGTLALTSAGYAPHQLHLVDTLSGTICQSLPLERAWNGLAWSRDGTTLYVAGGASPLIHVFKKQGDGTFAKSAGLTIPGLTQNVPVEPGKAPAYLAGIALSPDGRTLFVANISTDTLYAVGLPDGKSIRSRKLEEGARPYCLRAGPGIPELYITQWALSSIAILDMNSLETKRTIPTGNHPNDVLFAPNGRMFVSCGNEDSVYVHDPLTGRTRERLRVSLTPKSPAGATPNALAATPDGTTLFVANADNNAVAVIDISRVDASRVKGFIPTGWYPTAVASSPDGKRLFIGSGKGLGTKPNPVAQLPIDPTTPRGYEFIGKMLAGLVSMLPIPEDSTLAGFTRQVFDNVPYKDAMLSRPVRTPAAKENAIPSRIGVRSPIRYILYIIKENRTYDQVFGAFRDHTGKPRGNGDPNLTLFGEEVTPNQHALARKYVLLDNLFCSGEVSADGHPWSTGAYVTDITQHSWPAQYGGRGRAPLTEKATIPPAGYIWDLCSRAGIPYRSYGEYVYATGPDSPPEPLLSVDGATSLKGHSSAGWQAARAAGKRDFEKAEVFISELHAYELQNNLPRFMIMSLGENHTSGTRPGAFTPKASVASNDVALGRIVEACTRSKFWKEMAIFVIEDDAQNGPDHVDAHRTAALVISPYARRQHLDSTFYTTVSMLRTMELILGLPPMSQYDASATPMYNSFTRQPDFSTYTALPARLDLMARNPEKAFGARSSMLLDFSDYDRLTREDEDILNRTLWHSIKGEGVPYPAPVRSALIGRTGRSIIPERAETEEDK